MESKEDPRKGKPSASAYGRYLLCPGSFPLEREAKKRGEVPPEGDTDSKFGDKVHQMLHTGYDASATLEEKDVYDRTVNLRDIVRAKYFPSEGYTVGTELRMWFMDEISGQADRIEVDEVEKWAMLYDYKSLYGDHPVAAKNPQLRLLAYLTHRKYEVDKVVVAIIQPMIKGGYSVAEFGPDEFKQVHLELTELLTGWKMGNTGRTAGPEQCKFCPARRICPEYRKFAMQKINGSVGDLSAEELAAVLDRLPMMKKFIKEVETYSKLLLNHAPCEIPGYELAPGRWLRNVEDVEQAWKNLNDDLSVDEFLSCTKLQLGKLEKTYARVTDRTLSDAKDKIAEMLEGVIVPKQTDAILKKKKD